PRARRSCADTKSLRVPRQGHSTACVCDAHGTTIAAFGLMPRLPNLFGRTTSALDEHERLRAACKALRELCARGDEAAGNELALAAREFAGQLRRHFSAEESSGVRGVSRESDPG